MSDKTKTREELQAEFEAWEQQKTELSKKALDVLLKKADEGDAAAIGILIEQGWISLKKLKPMKPKPMPVAPKSVDLSGYKQVK